MKVNYVLMYGTPYLKYREFETFEDMSKFIVLKSIVHYTIFEKMEDKKEVEMIYRDNDINYLEQENKQLKERIDKAIEYLKENEQCPDDIDVWGQTEYDVYRILTGDSNE